MVDAKVMGLNGNMALNGNGQVRDINRTMTSIIRDFRKMRKSRMMDVIVPKNRTIGPFWTPLCHERFIKVRPKHQGDLWTFTVWVPGLRTVLDHGYP